MGKKVYVDLTHPFSAEIPRWPYFDKPEITNAHTMAKGGVLTSKITCTMHTGTHCDAPRHVMEYEFDGRRARYTHEMPIDAYTGEAVVLKLDVEPWTLITDKHLDEACKKCGIDPASLKGKVLCLNTGMHRLFDDSKAYYHYSIGTGIDAGKWFVKHGVKCVAMDSQALDHPLHTAMGNNGMTRMNLLGATGKPITEEYKELFGEEAYAEFDKFEYIRIHGQAAYYLKKGVLKAPLHFQFCMGCANGIPGSLKNLIFMKETMESLCPGSTWSCFGVGHCALEMLYGAVALGGHIRVGMEDNVMYAKGVLAESNVQFVERARRVIEEYGKQVATPAEAREILSLGK